LPEEEKCKQIKYEKSPPPPGDPPPPHPPRLINVSKEEAIIE